MSDPLKITEATALAFHAVVWIASSGGTMTTAHVAKSLSASPAHLAKVLQKMVHAGLLTATRGPSGGYGLARRPETIMLSDIYESMESTPRSDGCLFAAPVCGNADCIMGQSVREARRVLWEYLQKTSVADLVQQGS